MLAQTLHAVEERWELSKARALQTMLVMIYARMEEPLEILLHHALRPLHAEALGYKGQWGTLETHAPQCILVRNLDTKEELQGIFKTHAPQNVLVGKQEGMRLGASLHRAQMSLHAKMLGRVPDPEPGGKLGILLTHAPTLEHVTSLDMME